MSLDFWIFPNQLRERTVIVSGSRHDRIDQFTRVEDTGPFGQHRQAFASAASLMRRLDRLHDAGAPHRLQSVQGAPGLTRSFRQPRSRWPRLIPGWRPPSGWYARAQEAAAGGGPRPAHAQLSFPPIAPP